MTGKPVCLATRSAVRCRVPDSLGRDARVGHQLDGGAQDAGDVAVAGRSRRPSSPARAAGWRRTRRRAGSRRWQIVSTTLVVAEHDQRAGAAAQDALEAVAQRGAGGDGGEGGAQRARRRSAASARRLRPCWIPGPGGPRPVCASYRARRATPRPTGLRVLAASADAQPGWSRPRRHGLGHRGGLDDPRCRPAPGPPPTTPGGTTARVKPSRAASASAAVGPGDRPDLAGQADLADRDGAVRQRAVGDGAGQGQAIARSAAGSVSRTPPTVDR